MVAPRLFLFPKSPEIAPLTRPEVCFTHQTPSAAYGWRVTRALWCSPYHVPGEGPFLLKKRKNLAAKSPHIPGPLSQPISRSSSRCASAYSEIFTRLCPRYAAKEQSIGATNAFTGSIIEANALRLGDGKRGS